LKRYALGRRTIAFTVNVQHAQDLALAFLSKGIPAACVSAKTPVKTTEQIYKQLENAEVLVVCSCMKLTEGFDVPSVSAILLCRPTLSKSLYFQMVGRGLRLSPETGKTDCIVIDPSGNVQRHHYIEDLKKSV
jgi:superfamily II DNA or RNA helicase